MTKPNSASWGRPVTRMRTQSEPTMALKRVATLARMISDIGLLDRRAASLASPFAARSATWALVKPLGLPLALHHLPVAPDVG